jgi:hypothetical protein
MARVTVKVSDLTGNQIPDDESGARLVVEHPDFPEPIGLDVLSDEVLPLLTDENSRFVIVSMSDPESPNPQRYVLSLADFNQLFQRENMYNVLQRALESQQEEDATSRRGRGRKAASETPRPRVDYSSAGHAGEPHRGTVSEGEKEFVRKNLDEVNRRLREQGQREIDLNDPRMAARFGFPPPV